MLDADALAEIGRLETRASKQLELRVYLLFGGKATCAAQSTTISKA